jgi:hypothetical protein
MRVGSPDSVFSKVATPLAYGNESTLYGDVAQFLLTRGEYGYVRVPPLRVGLSRRRHTRDCASTLALRLAEFADFCLHHVIMCLTALMLWQLGYGWHGCVQTQPLSNVVSPFTPPWENKQPTQTARNE